ncbi:hypothetical protein BDW71DRAFT_176817 [Aspergillus fruticulosus]
MGTTSKGPLGLAVLFAERSSAAHYACTAAQPSRVILQILQGAELITSLRPGYQTATQRLDTQAGRGVALSSLAASTVSIPNRRLGPSPPATESNLVAHLRRRLSVQPPHTSNHGTLVQREA